MTTLDQKLYEFEINLEHRQEKMQTGTDSNGNIGVNNNNNLNDDSLYYEISN